MKDKSQNLYSSAHLFVAAVRIFEHQNNTPATLEDISRILKISIERSHYLGRKLKEMGIIDEIEVSYGIRLFIKDHLKIEDIPREDDGGKLEAELRKFKESQKELSHKIETIQAKQAEKKKNLFAEMEKKLKKELNKKT